VGSSGAVLENTFTFAIGSLGADFDFTDPTTWIDNFNIVDEDIYNETGLNEFGATAVNANAMAIGEQPYIFGYSSTIDFGLPGSEGVLFTSENWDVFPDPESLVSALYSVEQTTEVLFGAVNGNPDADGIPGLSNLGAFTHGFEGERLEDSPIPISTNLILPEGGPVEIQAFGFAAVPEPSAAIMGLLGSLMFLRRKRA